MSPVPCAPGPCHRCPKGQLAPLAHLWEASVPGLGSSLLLLPGAGRLLHTLFSLLFPPRVMWVTSASLAYQDPRYSVWGGVFFRFSSADWRQGFCLGEPYCTGMGRGLLLFVFLPDQCHSSKVHGAADPTKDAHRAPTTLPWPCSGHCHIRKREGKPVGVFQNTEESLPGGCPHSAGKHPIFCASFSPACLLQLLFTLHPQGWK